MSPYFIQTQNKLTMIWKCYLLLFALLQTAAGSRLRGSGLKNGNDNNYNGQNEEKANRKSLGNENVLQEVIREEDLNEARKRETESVPPLCKPWCWKKEQPWFNEEDPSKSKCGWRPCNFCSPCRPTYHPTISPQQDADSAIEAPEFCAKFCQKHHYPWHKEGGGGKCYWLSCSGCSECD